VQAGERLVSRKRDADGLKAHWQNEKERSRQHPRAKEQLEKLGTRSQRAQREGDLARAAEMRYGRFPN
jgi:ATP-dependent Clp protease ATP-binding subunit ClpB